MLSSILNMAFGLKMRDVLNSWVIPMSRSTHPEGKRLAMMVEDHPDDYQIFGGFIPKDHTIPHNTL